jgi:hypothetical protein
VATLAVFRTNIAAILGLDNATSGDQTQIDYYLNEGILEVLKNTKCYVASSALTGVSTADHTLSTSILEIRDFYVTSGGYDTKLERMTMDEILRMRRISPAVSSPSRYYALAGHDKLMFWPTPASADSFTLYYVPYPTALSNSAEAPSNSALGGVPAENHNVIERYALWKLADLDDDASSQMGETYRSEFYQGINEMRRHLRSKGGYKLGRVRVNPRRSPRTPSDPSVSVVW